MLSTNTLRSYGGEAIHIVAYLIHRVPFEFYKVYKPSQIFKNFFPFIWLHHNLQLNLFKFTNIFHDKNQAGSYAHKCFLFLVVLLVIEYKVSDMTNIGVGLWHF